MALFSRRNLKSNQYGLTKEDLKGDLKEFPMGVVVRMLEEQELQGNKPDVKVFQRRLYSDVTAGGFNWDLSEMGPDFWNMVLDEDLKNCNFNLFFEKYPEYERYNLS